MAAAAWWPGSRAEPLAAAPSCADVLAVFAPGAGRRLETSEETTAFFAAVREAAGQARVESVELGEPTTGGVADLLEAEASWLGGPLGGDYRAGVRRARAAIAAFLDGRRAECPDQRWVLGGYSQGAHRVGEALFDLDRATRDRIAFVAFFGDPKLLTNGRGIVPPACRGDQHPWVRGNVRCYHPGGILEPRDPYVPADLVDRTGSWCDKQDGICTGNVAMAGDGAHDAYAEAEIPEAGAEIAGRLRG